MIPTSWIVAIALVAVVIILLIPDRHKPPWERWRD